MTAGKIVIALSSQINPAKIATLKNDNASNIRLNKCAYWMHKATLHGLDLGQLITQAMMRYEDTDKRRAITKCSLLKNYKRMVRFGCFSDENLPQLRRGNSATITKGTYTGQKMEVDHVVPKSLMPTLAKDFANLCYQPHRINREKSDAVARAQLRTVKIFARHGIVPYSTIERMQQLQGLSVRAARVFMPGAVAHLKSVPPLLGFGAGGTDPRIIIASVRQLIDRIGDWEPRADSALSTADLMQRHTAEHLKRTQALLGQAHARAEEDATAARRLETELANMHSRGASEMSRAEKSMDNANGMSRRARQTSQHWKREENFAGAWQRRAQYRENKARNEVERAEEALGRAQSALAHAETQLERARERTRVVGRDSDGKAIREPIDTTPYENKVAAAQERVERCEERLGRANDELDKATTERQASEARVDACNQAVKLANDAETASASALQSAHIAMSAVERASEEHARARYFTELAGKAARRAQAAVATIAKHTAAAATFESNAVTSMHAAQTHHASSRQRSTLGCMEMSWRMEQLRAFDRPINEF